MMGGRKGIPTGTLNGSKRPLAMNYELRIMNYEESGQDGRDGRSGRGGLDGKK